MERIVGGSLTSNIVDRHKALAVLAYARERDCTREALNLILAARLSWLNWQSITQRQWQRETRNHNKARHSDSIELREKYVRCKSGGNY